VTYFLLIVRWPWGRLSPYWKWVPETFLGGKGGRCMKMTSPPSCAECHEIWEPKPLWTLWATPGLLWDCFTFTCCLHLQSRKAFYHEKWESKYLWNNSTYLPKYRTSCLWKLHSQDKNTVPQTTDAACQQNNNWAHSNPCKWLYFLSQSHGLDSEAALLPSWLRSLAIRWTVPGLNPGSGEIFRTHPDQPWDPLGPLHKGCRFIPVDKAGGVWH
jgi:hypothetical protein